MPAVALRSNNMVPLKHRINPFANKAKDNCSLLGDSMHSSVSAFLEVSEFHAAHVQADHDNAANNSGCTSDHSVDDHKTKTKASGEKREKKSHHNRATNNRSPHPGSSHHHHDHDGSSSEALGGTPSSPKNSKSTRTRSKSDGDIDDNAKSSTARKGSRRPSTSATGTTTTSQSRSSGSLDESLRESAHTVVPSSTSSSVRRSAHQRVSSASVGPAASSSTTLRPPSDHAKEMDVSMSTVNSYMTGTLNGNGDEILHDGRDHKGRALRRTRTPSSKVTVGRHTPLQVPSKATPTIIETTFESPAGEIALPALLPSVVEPESRVSIPKSSTPESKSKKSSSSSRPKSRETDSSDDLKKSHGATESRHRKISLESALENETSSSKKGSSRPSLTKANSTRTVSSSRPSRRLSTSGSSSKKHHSSDDHHESSKSTMLECTPEDTVWVGSDTSAHMELDITLLMSQQPAVVQPEIKKPEKKGFLPGKLFK